MNKISFLTFVLIINFINTYSSVKENKSLYKNQEVEIFFTTNQPYSSYEEYKWQMKMNGS